MSKKKLDPIYANVSKMFAVQPEHVANVDRGTVRSARISAALAQVRAAQGANISGRRAKRISIPIHVALRRSITAAIKASPKTRDQIAREMSRALNFEIGVKTLNAWTSDSRRDFRFPLEYLPSFCEAVGSTAILKVVVQKLGLEVIDRAEVKQLRAYKRFRRAERSLRKSLSEEDQ